jgi:hypothetical protein
MSTTTPNFGWVVPTSSDLVKNGAVAIETLGDSIDASMVDLKGGTTGQVLSKTSATDMDFSWVAASSGSSYVAGKNFVINGGMDVWQRGTTGFSTATGTYTADRWVLGSSSTTVTQDTDVPVSPYFKYSLKMVGTGDNSLIQRVESVNSTLLAGQTITFSFYAKRTSGTGALDVRFYYPTTADTYGAITQIGSTVVVSASPTSSWTRYSVTAAIGTNITTGLQILINNTGATTTFITGAQLEIAAAASSFSRNASTYSLELASCQRYYQRWSASQFSRAGFIYADSITNAVFVDKLPICLRTTPTLTFSNMTANGNAITAAAVASILSTANSLGLNLTTSGVLANTVYQLYVASGTTGVIAYESEL